MDTFETKYGRITLYKNELYIRNDFIKGKYWDEDTLLQLKKYIDPTRNILEIGGHCGTSTLVYSTFLNDTSKIFVYEPQYNLYSLLLENINQNNLQHKIIANNLGVFCYEGPGRMNNIDVDGQAGIVSEMYKQENEKFCNYGGIALGKDGEIVSLTTIDSMNLDDIGFIHCDAQGSENFIFSKGLETIKKYRPVIYYEDNQVNAKFLYNIVCKAYPEYVEESKFNLKKYCMEELQYSNYIEKFNGGHDTLLLP